ncbi:MAG: hypothetical protein ABIT36_04185 [Steroidobacteraceae bacterium]
MAAAPEVGSVVTKTFAALLLLLGSPVFAQSEAPARVHGLVIAGLGGEPGYDRAFREQGANYAAALRKLAGASPGQQSNVHLLSGADANRERVRRELAALATNARPQDEVIIALLGHGSFDGEEYRFNLSGPDITGTELTTAFNALQARAQLIVNTSSASGAVADRWKKPGRVVITATRSGTERNATRFGNFWVQALGDDSADADKNGMLSAQEAFAFASRKVADSYKTDVALATEHPRLVGDNAERVVAARLAAIVAFAPDDRLNALLNQREALDRELDTVRERKATLEADNYYEELEKVLVRIALLRRQIDARQLELKGGSSGA